MNLEVLSKLTKCLLSTDSRKGNLRLENGGGDYGVGVGSWWFSC